MFEQLSIDYKEKSIAIHLDATKTGQADGMLTECKEVPEICPFRIMMVYYNRVMRDADKTIKDGVLIGRIFRTMKVRRGVAYFNENMPMGVNTVGDCFKRVLMQYKEHLPEDIKWEIDNDKPTATRSHRFQKPRYGLDRYTSHAGKRTLGNIMAEYGFTATEIQTMLRHKNISTAQEYIDKNSSKVKSASQKLMSTLSGIKNNNDTADFEKMESPIDDYDSPDVGEEERSQLDNIVEKKNDVLTSNKKIIFTNCTFNGAKF
ncbi:hypothetical protein AKO1_001239 [Acrasis kona]|uniref:Tyr recombinase domain-containing protein n=1 Tax=Acrasis kona TaxID=1008807 RepID=A0AAW2YI40_9EUKA